MSATLLIALAAGIPLAGASWLAAVAVERLGADVRLRLAAWTAALIVPIALAPAALTIEALGIRSPLAALKAQPAAPVPAAAPAGPVAVAQAPVFAAVPATSTAPSTAPATFTPPSITWTQGILAVLALVAALRLTVLAFALRRISKLVAASEPIEDAGYGGAAPVRQSDHDTPVLAGLRRPVVLLPRKLVESLTPAQAALICAHEQAHLAAGDHVAHLIEEAALRLFWFNPVLGLIRTRLSAAREEACDARALAASDSETRRAYAQSLVAALRLAGDAEPIAAFTGLGHHDASRRLLAILHPRAGVSAPAVAAAGLLAVCLAAATGGLSLALAAQPLASSNSSSPAAQTIRVVAAAPDPAARAESAPETAPAPATATIRGRAQPASAVSAATAPFVVTMRSADAPPALASVSRSYTGAGPQAAEAPSARSYVGVQVGGADSPRALAPLSSIHVQNGGLVILRHGAATSFRSTNGRANVSVNANGRMTVSPCDDCGTVEVTSPNVPPLSVKEGGSITVASGFPAQAEGSAAVAEGGMINMTAVSLKNAAAAIKEGGQIMIRSSDNLTAGVKEGGNILYQGAAKVNSHVKDGGWVHRTGD